MAVPTHELITTVDLAGSSSVAFTSLPTVDSQGNDFANLVIHLRAIPTETTRVDMRFNSVTQTEYSFVTLLGKGTTPDSDRSFGDNSLRPHNWFIDPGINSALMTYHIMNYQSTNTRTTGIMRVGTTDSGAGTGSNTFAFDLNDRINRIDIFLTDGNFDTGANVQLYGLVK